ncbi:MAG: hypothetical protein KC636_17245, partial [Myxococcales bacterium]|nr:hypothetical protein [Myxococcales bacterium]
ENYIVCDQSLNKNDPMAPFHALGIGCSQDPLESIIVSNTMFQSPDPNAWQIAKGFGTYVDPMTNELIYSPVEGESFIMISSGVVSAPNGQGVITEMNGQQDFNNANGNPDDNSLPAGMSVSVGSNNGNGGTPGMNCAPDLDCSDSLQAQWQLGFSDPNDKIWLSWTTTVPTGVLSYTLQFAYFSSEWPVWFDTQYNDLLIIWESSEDYWGNISVIDDKPTTITALGDYWTVDPNPSCNGDTDGPGYTCNEPQLQGTGFEGHAGSDWISINRPITEGENLRVFVFLADMGDTALATGALIDGFRWNCDECIPADDPLCTGEVPDPNCCGVILPM